MASKVKGTTDASPPSNSNLPKGWHTVRFGDVVRDVNESERNPLDARLERYVGLEHIEPENLHLKQWGMLADSEISFRKRFRKGQVLFGKRRAYQRKVAVAEFDGICSSDILTFEPKGDALIPELLPFIVQSDGFFKHALGTSSGSLSPRTRWSQLQDYEFPLPPKDEQRRIADILWAVDEVIECWRNSRESVALLKTNLMSHHFRPGNGYTVIALQEVARVQTGIAKGREYDSIPTVELPYLRVANVQDGFLDLLEMKTITVALDEVERYRVKIGDVLMTEGGDFDKLGRGTIWRGEVEKCLHQNHVFCVRPDSNKLLPEYLTYQTASPYGKAYFLKCAKKTSNLASINSTQVKQFPVLVPDLEEQHHFVGRLTVLDRAASGIESHLAMLDGLKKQLTSDLLLGGRHVH